MAGFLEGCFKVVEMGVSCYFTCGTPALALLFIERRIFNDTDYDGWQPTCY